MPVPASRDSILIVGVTVMILALKPGRSFSTFTRWLLNRLGPSARGRPSSPNSEVFAQPADRFSGTPAILVDERVFVLGMTLILTQPVNC